MLRTTLKQLEDYIHEYYKKDVTLTFVATSDYMSIRVFSYELVDETELDVYKLFTQMPLVYDFTAIENMPHITKSKFVFSTNYTANHGEYNCSSCGEPLPTEYIVLHHSDDEEFIDAVSLCSTCIENLYERYI